MAAGDIMEPMTPPDCDLRGLEWMPLYGGRLFGSDFDAHASDAEWRAAIQLWWAAWNQVPAASLPDDDVALCRLAGFGRDVKGWAKVRARALHGFVKCSDGRLYHRALAVFATESWARRLKDRERKAKYRAAKERSDERDGTRTETGTGRGPDAPRDGPGTADRTGEDRTGQDVILNMGATPPAAQERDGHDKQFKLPEGWVLSDDCRDYARGKGLDPEAVREGFLDYFVGGRGKREKRTADGWERRWRIWCNRDADGPAGRSAASVRPRERGSELAAFARGVARVVGDEPL